jgi:hypothetical protein
MRNVLITADEVIFHAPTKQTLDRRTIEQSIIIAEERFIRPALCDEFYEQIVIAKNREITSGNKGTTEGEILVATGETVVLQIGEIVNAWEYLNADLQKFWKEHLWKLTAECVMLLATPEAFVQFASEGVVHGAPPAGPMTTTGLVSPELRSVKWIMDKKLMDRIDPLLEAMHRWLCKRKATYSNYCKVCDCDANGVAYKRKSDLVTGLYDDVDKDINCNCGCYD